MSENEGRAAKRPRTDDTASADTNTKTQQLYESLVRQNNLQIHREQFVGICAYLCAILRWGYPMRVNEMDLFVCYYPQFEACLSETEQLRAADQLLPIPSYHQWFQKRRQGEREEEEEDEEADVRSEQTPTSVLDEPGLRQVWQENPYTFLRAELSLDFIAGLKHPNRQKRLGTSLFAGVRSDATVDTVDGTDKTGE